MKKNVKTLLAIGAMVFSFTTISAQEETTRDRKRPDPEKMIAKLDTDQDGKLSKEEAEAAEKGKLAERFDTIDTNSDGFLELEELAAAPKKGGRKPED
ncbi:hypothetical protein GCM10022393_08690 [Aquimarina addita]|uniref:EF-hand domain-containing protein n=1 Tax=Aquimarina addita TaxID=870485 RepID=A0ABP7XC83_9FLAO